MEVVLNEDNNEKIGMNGNYEENGNGKRKIWQCYNLANY